MTTMNTYVRARFEKHLGPYSVRGSLLVFPLTVIWRHRLFPVAVRWGFFIDIPHEERIEQIAQSRRHLEEHPEDFFTGFVLGNLLRMDGQIAAAREQYQQVAQSEHGHKPFAIKVLKELEGVSDHRGGVTSRQIRCNNPRLP